MTSLDSLLMWEIETPRSLALAPFIVGFLEVPITVYFAQYIAYFHTLPTNMAVSTKN